MKLKGIWITICLIVVSGVCVTSYTKQYTSETVVMRSLEPVEGIPETAAAGGELHTAPTAAPRSAEKDEMTVGKTAAADSRMSADAAPEAEELSAAMQELMDLDEQIARSHTGSVDTTANSLKASAENEWKLWEARMDRFLDILEEKLPEAEKEKLFLEQKEWIRDREATATASSKKQSGSALVELEYNLTSKEITRARAYELASRYEKELAEE